MSLLIDTGAPTFTPSSEIDDETRWRQVLVRDSRYDGSFVYAVRSTGVYCRPSCPSRRPAMKQVSFFPDPKAAEQTGYRACRRCRPQEQHPDGPDTSLVRRACQYFNADRPETFSPAEIASLIGVTPLGLSRAFKRVTGVTFRHYADAARVQRLKGNLRTGQDVTQALYDAGYGSSSRLYEQSSAQLGMTPGVYKRGGRGTQVFYTIVACSLGQILVAMTEKGICAVSLGDDCAALESGLLKEYPAAKLQKGGRQFQNKVEDILNIMEGQTPSRELPLDVQATAFQRSVWQHLQKISLGQTRSYSQVAASWATPGRLARWPRPAPPTRWPWWSPATGWSHGTVRLGATAGEWTASRRF